MSPVHLRQRCHAGQLGFGIPRSWVSPWVLEKVGGLCFYTPGGAGRYFCCSCTTWGVFVWAGEFPWGERGKVERGGGTARSGFEAGQFGSGVCFIQLRPRWEQCNSAAPHSLQGAVSGSVQATDRLMKELRDIYRSPSFKGGKCREGGRGLLAVGTFPFVLGSTGGASEPDPFAPWCCCGENLGPWVAVAQKRAEQPLVVSVPRLCWMEARSLPWVGGLLRQKLVFDAFSSSTLPCVTGFVGHVAHTPSPNRCRQDALFRGKPVPG